MDEQNKKAHISILIVGIFLLLGCQYSQPNPIKVIKGSIDLSHASFSEPESFKLDGEWEFYYGQFLAPKDFFYTNSPISFLKLPGFWNGINIEGRTLEGTGFATVRLKIKSPADIKNYGLYIPHAFTTYRLFVNGIQISENGVPGTTKNETKEYWLPRAVFFTNESSTIEIIIQLANFKSVDGGFRQSIEFGTAETILNIKQKRLAIDLFFIGCLFVISLYHLSIFMLRKVDQSLLYFSIYSFLGLLYQAASGEYSLVLLFPNIDWLLLIKIFLNSAFLSFPILFRFLKILFPDETNHPLHTLLEIIFLILVTVIFLTQSRALEISILVGEILVLFASIYILYVLIKSSINKRESALGFLFGYIVFFIFTINDILFEKNIVHSEIYGPIGTLFLFFSQSFFLSKKFTKLYVTIEKQNAELEKNAVLSEKIYQSDIHSKRMELELLKKTIQPHFLMNSLSAIRYWIIEKPENSTELLDALSGELRIIQDVASKKSISIMDEYRLCKYHISVMKMRMEKSYRLTLRGFQGDEMIPPLLFHTLLENAFTHEDSANARLSFCIFKKKKTTLDKHLLYFCFLIHNHKKNTERKRIPGSGTGMDYIKLRLEESFPGKWKLDHGKTKFGYRVIMRIEGD